MAHVREKNGYRYIYDRIDGKERCVKKLGQMGAKDADIELSKYVADNGRESANVSDRSIESLREEYVQYLIAEEYSPLTVRCVESCLFPFLATMSKLRELTASYIDKWDKILQTWPKRRGSGTLSRESRRHRLLVISAFCGWLKERKYVKKSPFEAKIPEGRKDAGRALRGDQVHQLFDKWPMGTPWSKKEFWALSKLFFKIVFYGGTRITEVCGMNDEHPGLCYEDVDRKGCFIKLNRTKAGEEREVALPKEVIEAIPEGTGPIFWGKISDCTMRNHLKMACEAAGIKGRFRVHDGRVTAATEWARKNRDPKASMDQFGWKTEKMAMHYQKVATEERVQQAQNITYK
jgi:integrase